MVLTRMHSSRMRTGRSLTVWWHLLPGGCLVPEGMSAPGEGVSAPRGLVPGGIPACTEADTHPPPPLWTESQMPVKHYLGPTSLRWVIKKKNVNEYKVSIRVRSHKFGDNDTNFLSSPQLLKSVVWLSILLLRHDD